MLNITSDAPYISLYNDTYQKMMTFHFENSDNKDTVSQILLILQKKLVFIAQSTAIFTVYPDEFVNGVNQLNQLVKRYNAIYPISPIALLPSPPKPQLFESIPMPLKSITHASDLGVTYDWNVAALKTGSIVTGIACNLMGATAGRYGMQAANTLLGQSVAEAMLQDMIENIIKATALGSLNGAAFVAPFVGIKALIIDATEQKLCEHHATQSYENPRDETEWEYIEPGIQLILSTAAHTFEQNNDHISACLFDDLYALNASSYLLVQETYDESEILAVVQTLEYLAYYFTIFYPESKRILYDIITSYYANIFEQTEYYSRLQTLQTICKPEPIYGKVAAYAFKMIAFPGYDLIDWTKSQQLKANPPKTLLEKLGEIRQFNKKTLTNIHAMNYKQYHTELLSLYSKEDLAQASDLALHRLMRELGLAPTIEAAPLLQKFSNRLSKEPEKSNKNKIKSETAEEFFCIIQ